MSSTRLRRARVRFASRRNDERGAYAVLMSFLLVVLVGLAAISVDVALQVDSKQRLRDTMDAAAQAAAMAIGETNANVGTAVRAAAAKAAVANGHDGPLDTSFWCVVASTGDTKQVVDTQIPSTCDPGRGKPYTTGNPRYAGLVCDEALCFIPCDPAAGTCNTVRIASGRDVDYKFAPAIGFDQGSTGTVVSVACKGACGTEQPNPLDVVIMADRTTSMPVAQRKLMQSAIESSLKVMNPDLHYVAMGTLHKSESRKVYRDDVYECPTHESGVRQRTSGWDSTPVWNDDDTPSLTSTGNASAGRWVAVPFSNTYLTDAETPTINGNDQLVRGLRCLPTASTGGYGTHLAASLKGAARYLLNLNPGTNPNNLSSLPPRTGMGEPQKVIIFETDGAPDESLNSSYQGLRTNNDDFGAGGQASGGVQGCKNFVEMAKEVKKENIRIITIGFGNAGTAKCSTTNPGWGQPAVRNVRDVLAEAASPDRSGAASTASNCSIESQRVTENTDKDNFYCAATGQELEEIFRSALTSVSESVKLLKMPS